ncbi:MAG: DUF3108 domain-containing protein [Cyclobacteriaceae bacterium]|nr:DUF3108 domain-containing protein [Cyclobacteriaceae bacterium]
MKFQWLFIGLLLVPFFTFGQEVKSEDISDFIYSDTVVSDDPRYEEVVNNSFGKGERLTFKVSFGWFTVGKGLVVIKDNYYRINHRDCFKVDVYGKTSGLIDWVAEVDDHWAAYIDTASLVTHMTYRNIKEGNYRKNEVVKFDHVTDMIEVKVLNRNTGAYKEPNYYKAPNNVRDMIAGIMYLRVVDFSNHAIGDTLKVSGFFEDTFYNMKVIYAKKEVIKTKVGRFNTIKLVPVMPENSLFDGENSIAAWISDDENKIPVKVEAEMFIGHAGVEIIEFEGLKNTPNLVEEEKNKKNEKLASD